MHSINEIYISILIQIYLCYSFHHVLYWFGSIYFLTDPLSNVCSTCILFIHFFFLFNKYFYSGYCVSGAIFVFKKISPHNPIQSSILRHREVKETEKFHLISERYSPVFEPHFLKLIYLF